MAEQVPREMIAWFPKIDMEKCTGCSVCVDFCSHGVYKLNENMNKAEVYSPFECIVGCSNCVGQCPAEAVSFPSLEQCKEMIDRARAEMEKKGEGEKK